MKIIQSFWANDRRRNGGWLSARYHHMSLALSCLQLSRYHDQIELYTNEEGKSILIDKLGLPYSKVHILDSKMGNGNEDIFFSYCKLQAISMQKEPFLHVDGDVFVWQKFAGSFFNSQVVVQSIDFQHDSYRSFANLVVNTLPTIQPFLSDFAKNTAISLPNAGVIGGTDIDFFCDYCREAFSFIRANGNEMSRFDSSLHSACVQFSEEFMLSAYACKRGIIIQPYLTNVDSDFFNITRMNEVPHKRHYIHFIGGHKQWIFNSKCLEEKLELEHPLYYDQYFSERENLFFSDC